MLSFDRLVEMVNAKNEPTYPLSDGTVRFIDVIPDLTQAHNTRVTMQSIPGGNYSGQVDLFYTRVNLTELGDLTFVQEAPFTFESLLGLIGNSKGAPASPDDFTNGDIPEMETGIPVGFILSASDASLAWLGNTQVHLLTGIPNEAKNLNTFLTTQAAAMFA